MNGIKVPKKTCISTELRVLVTLVVKTFFCLNAQNRAAICTQNPQEINPVTLLSKLGIFSLDAFPFEKKPVPKLFSSE